MASQHRFSSEMHDRMLYQNVWKKLIWHLKFIFKTSMLIWKERNRTVFKCFEQVEYFVFATVQHLFYKDWFNDVVAKLQLLSHRWRDQSAGAAPRHSCVNNQAAKQPQLWEEEIPRGTAQSEMVEFAWGPLTSHRALSSNWANYRHHLLGNESGTSLSSRRKTSGLGNMKILVYGL